jgi:hypothetical protein
VAAGLTGMSIVKVVRKRRQPPAATAATPAPAAAG